MRVLVVTTGRQVVGGAETYLRAVLPLLRERGLEVALLTVQPGAEGRAQLDDLCPGIASWVATDPAAVLAVADAWHPDVIYAHGLPEPEAEAALARQFPAVYFAHGYSGLCVNGTKAHAFPGPQPCPRSLGAACLGLYFPRRCGGLNPLTMMGLYRTNRQRQRLLALYSGLIAASEHMARELVRNGVPPDRVTVAPLFPPSTRPDPQPPAPKPRSNRVLFIGRITALKGWRELLDALPRAAAKLGRRLTLVVAGEGPDSVAFEAEARRRRIPAEFLGWLGADRLEAEMRSADVLAVPSVWPEPFGLVGVEAACVGLPAVAFAVGGISGWLIPGVSGELAAGPRLDSRKLASALGRVLADDARWQRLRVGAWEAARNFTPESHLGRLIPVLEAAAGSMLRSAPARDVEAACRRLFRS
jgi:glycosyltransferase involved in cell wall biosynthesis